MIIQHNMQAYNSSKNYNIVLGDISKSMEKLSSGYKINRAADDAAGLKISEGMRYMIRGLGKASQNAQDGISLLQTAEGALGEMHSVVQRMRELSVQAANDTNTDTDRQAIQDEIDCLITEIDRIADDTEFNTIKLLDGTLEDTSVSNSSSSKFRILIHGIADVNGTTTNNPIVDSTATSAIGSTKAYNLQDTLVNSIVPQAVNSFLNTFSVFGSAAANGQVSNEIGLKVYCDNSTTLAYVACRYGYYSDGTLASDSIALNLSVNVNTLTFEGDQLSTSSRTELETTIVHEMMHAFMDDTLTNGMLGATNGKLDSTNGFPSWFKEGMAQSASGGCSNGNDWVNGGLGITENSSDTSISSVIKSSANSLSSGSTSSQYGTGYLACMYLGYMAAGKPSNLTSADLANGLNSVLGNLMNGSSLDDVINNISNRLYTSTSDFENKFGDSSSTEFISKLLKTVGSTGNGGVVSSLTADDLLSDTDTTSSVYVADVNNEYVTSSVGNNRNWGTGGVGSGGNSSGGSGGTGGNGGGTGGGSGGTPNLPLGALKLQVGALKGQGVAISLEDMHASKLGITGMSVRSFSQAGAAIDACDEAIKKISDTRTKIGANINRLEHTIKSLDNTAENTQAAESRIRDIDMASEMVEYSMKNILAQAAQAILTQANKTNEQILTLL